MYSAGESLLAGEGAVVTGAACGIGRAITAALSPLPAHASWPPT